VPFQGVWYLMNCRPRALPWADMPWPFRPEYRQHWPFGPQQRGMAFQGGMQTAMAFQAGKLRFAPTGHSMSAWGK
jgi:hypothetical protein